MKSWSLKEVNFLKENYNKYTLLELTKLLNKTKNAIANKASRLYLTEARKEIIYTIEELKEITSKYKCRVEFKIKNWVAYNYCINNNLLDDVCSYSTNYSIPQLILKYILEQIFNENCIYNTRDIITPYELDLFFKKYNLGFEYNGKGWHIDNKNDILKLNICEELGIFLIVIEENNRIYEQDIKNQLIKNLNLINKITKLNIKNEDILNIKIDIYSLIPDKEDLKKEILKYNNYKHLKLENIKLYYKLKRLKSIKLIYELIG